jgi:hypothetical protein
MIVKNEECTSNWKKWYCSEEIKGCSTNEAGTGYPSRAPAPVFSGVRVTLSLVLCVCFLDFCLSICPFSFDHCVVYPLIYGFGLSLWYLQTLDKRMNRQFFLVIFKFVAYYVKRILQGTKLKLYFVPRIII